MGAGASGCTRQDPAHDSTVSELQTHREQARYTVVGTTRQAHPPATAPANRCRRDNLLPHAVSALWRVLTDPAEGGGMSQQIDQAVHAALAQQRDSDLQRCGQAAATTGS